ncbi:protealysin inhibitor emfourin [Microbacterium sp. NPDC058342]|uniref:protealysin inhibitor emfourin n=1 Tax=Microbacterium sp. NPDC058342 TaxID=3346454 RepID=UPI00364A45D9
MREYEPPGDGPDARDDANSGRIIVAVVRTGGLAGLRRRWRVEPAPEQTPQWAALVDRCPWDDRLDPEGAAGADRYVWSIHAVVRDEQREQVIPDTLLQGAWRELVDAVRDADAAGAAQDRTAPS